MYLVIPYSELLFIEIKKTRHGYELRIPVSDIPNAIDSFRQLADSLEAQWASMDEKGDDQ